MPSLAQRMRKLQTRLLAIRVGPGAILLPQNVKRVHMRFAAEINGGHRGPRKFWRHQLVRMKYHNPAVPMTVDQLKVQDAETEAIMSIHFTSPNPTHMTSDSATASPAPIESTTTTTIPSDHDPVERVETINMKHKTESQILDELIRLTGAYTIEPTEAEKEELRLLEEQQVRSERDSKAAAERRAAAKREKEMLEQARGEIAAQSA